MTVKYCDAPFKEGACDEVLGHAACDLSCKIAKLVQNLVNEARKRRHARASGHRLIIRTMVACTTRLESFTTYPYPLKPKFSPFMLGALGAICSAWKRDLPYFLAMLRYYFVEFGVVTLRRLRIH
jgi:hypothetical protein